MASLRTAARYAADGVIHETYGALLGAVAVVAEAAEEHGRARHAELDHDAAVRGLARPGDRFGRRLARYVDPMASQVRHADRLDRRTYGGAVAVGPSPSTVDRWTRARWLGGPLLYPWWVGWLPTLRSRQWARRVVALRFPWCRPTDFGADGLVEWSTVGLESVDTEQPPAVDARH
jgi:hypothetical protein